MRATIGLAISFLLYVMAGAFYPAAAGVDTGPSRGGGGPISADGNWDVKELLHRVAELEAQVAEYGTGEIRNEVVAQLKTEEEDRASQTKEEEEEEEEEAQRTAASSEQRGAPSCACAHKKERYVGRCQGCPRCAAALSRRAAIMSTRHAIDQDPEPPYTHTPAAERETLVRERQRHRAHSAHRVAKK